LKELESALLNLAVPITEIIGSGGGETKGTQRMRRAFNEVGWQKFVFEIRKIINGVEREAISHEVDHVKEFEGYKIALEIEWNNKDPFFDRDLENFKRLHAEGAISVGVIVTRGSSLHDKMRDFVLRFAKEQSVNSFEDLERLDVQLTRRKKTDIQKRVERPKNPIDFAVAWTDNFVSDKYGEATTHWKKLLDRISRGVGNPCPLLLIGLPSSIVSFEVQRSAKTEGADAA
ncbi:MAG: BglII/BstYI family type II restriction endonuclease, partial [Candidatus Acidiferrum sp.]